MKGLSVIGVLVISVLAIFASTQFFPQLRAEDDANTPEEVTQKFLFFVVPSQRIIRFEEDEYAEAYTPRDLRAIVSRKNVQQLSASGVDQLAVEIWRRTAEKQWKTQKQKSASGKSVTVLATRQANASYPVVCVKDGKNWRVDIIETFGKWFNLDERRKQEKIVEITGVAISPLAYERDGGQTLCQKRLKQLSLGFAQYMQDYDELSPPDQKWADAIKPYVRGEDVFHCPAANNNYGYAMNSLMSRKNVASVNESAWVVLVYESQQQRRNYSGVGKDIAYRHKNGTNIAFVDGHVKWFPRNAKEQWPHVIFPVR